MTTGNAADGDGCRVSDGVWTMHCVDGIGRSGGSWRVDTPFKDASSRKSPNARIQLALVVILHVIGKGTTGGVNPEGRPTLRRELHK